MVSADCNNEITIKLMKKVGNHAHKYIFPAVKKALEEGSGKVRKQILSDWLNVESCRVCDECGAIMQEGWYNMGKYACSDECVIHQEEVTREEFDRYSIYKETLCEYLRHEGKGRKPEDLTQEEIDRLIEMFLEECDAYYTSWE